MSIYCLVLYQREAKKKKERDKITNNIQFSPAAVAFINASALSKGGVTRTAKLTMKHMHTQPQIHTDTRLEADAVLISVTAAEPLTAQITAGVQTMEGKGCLHKGEHRNKGFMGCKHPLA